MRPKSRSEKLIQRQLDGDLLLYDLDSFKAHSLNPSAALVFELCDGKRSVEELARTVAERLGMDDGAPIVHLALDRLHAAKLLEKGSFAATTKVISRRELLKALGAAASLLPVVSSLLAPTALSAASTIAVGTCTGRMSPNCGTPLPSKCFPNGGNTFCKRVGTTMACNCL